MFETVNCFLFAGKKSLDLYVNQNNYAILHYDTLYYIIIYVFIGLTYLDSLSCEEEDADKRHIIHYLNYGPFSSSTPTYDSTFANLTKKESDLVLSYYGNQNGFDYIQSLRAFVADGDSGLIKLVEDLANLWTAHKHSEVCYLLVLDYKRNAEVVIFSSKFQPNLFLYC